MSIIICLKLQHFKNQMFYINCTQGGKKRQKRKEGEEKRTGVSVTWHNAEGFRLAENSGQIEVSPIKLVLDFLLQKRLKGNGFNRKESPISVKTVRAAARESHHGCGRGRA